MKALLRKKGVILNRSKGFALSDSRGFTFIELIIVVGIIMMLFSIVTINLLHTQHNASVSATIDELVSDLKAQQTKAMTGAQDSTGNPNSYGVHITSTGYVLFQGTSDPSNATDFTVSPSGVSFTTNLPNSIIVFGERSGEFSNYVSGPYTITVSNVSGSEQKTITLNKYGVVTNVQ